jgi:hypothetical protein
MLRVDTGAVNNYYIQIGVSNIFRVLCPEAAAAGPEGKTVSIKFWAQEANAGQGNFRTPESEIVRWFQHG